MSIQNEWAHAWWNAMWKELGKIISFYLWKHGLQFNVWIMHVKWCALLIINACNHEDDACGMMCSYPLSVYSIMINACSHEDERLKKFLSNLTNIFSFSPGYSFTVSTGLTRNLLLFWFFSFFWFSMIFLWTVNNSVLRNWLSHTCPSCFFMLKGVSTITCFPPY